MDIVRGGSVCSGGGGAYLVGIELAQHIRLRLLLYLMQCVLNRREAEVRLPYSASERTVSGSVAGDSAELHGTRGGEKGGQRWRNLRFGHARHLLRGEA